ncbi:hypothetical protein GOP47_0012126 [Adiantum capillus-veneris]|uniref:MsrB domain-containing protein n=1 Tax=Adiantum capillus-veneris TaxID=13818 RepID=A0A9D4UQF3_ADICA|nr:hypothetical protein GOP47_0012126 [Adiantum capillus-veneris]
MALWASLPSSTSALTSSSRRATLSTSLARLRVGRPMAFSGAAGKEEKSEQEWRAILSPEQFRILRQKGTEWAGTGKYNKFYEEGIYECAGCGTPLYKSTTKFDSGCGWPAFYEGLPAAINETVCYEHLEALFML